jgi:hypothetical protein
MSIMTYFEAAPGSTSRTGNGLFKRFVDRVIAAQQARVAAELKRHSHLLPRELDQVTWKLSERSEDSLPFVR